MTKRVIIIFRFSSLRPPLYLPGIRLLVPVGDARYQYGRDHVRHYGGARNAC